MEPEGVSVVQRVFSVLFLFFALAVVAFLATYQDGRIAKDPELLNVLDSQTAAAFLNSLPEAERVKIAPVLNPQASQ